MVIRIVKRAGAPSEFSINPEPNVFDDHLLDVFGNEFKFDHAKGLAEWMKNSADAYSTTAQVKDSEQFIVLRFKQGKPKKLSVFECIDFVGMTKRDIIKAFKRWGDPNAAKKGTNVPTLGGHGNGGKFYMRQMFETSRFITYRGGLLNVFGFDDKRRYGFAKGYEDKRMPLEDALKFAGISDLDIPKSVRKRWSKKTTNAGFTVVQGSHPDRFNGRATLETVLEKLRTHPQARRLLQHKQVIVVPYGESWGSPLVTPPITPKEGFEDTREIHLPKRYMFEGEKIAFRTKKHPTGARLILRTSEAPLSRASSLAAMNTIDIIGEVGCIGSYKMNELGFLQNGPESEFMYGECDCPMLEEDEGEYGNSVKNDREKLVENTLTRALIAWIREQVDELAGEMAEKRRGEKKSHDLRDSSAFNQLLDKWKNQFMVKLTDEIFGGSGIGSGAGGIGGAGSGEGGDGAAGEGGNDEGDGMQSGKKKGGGSDAGDTGGGGDDGSGGGGGDTPQKGSKFPRVLLSSHDKDPLNPTGATVECDQRQPPVYQRVADVAANIFWINTSRPLANRIWEKYGAKSPRMREYLFQRYVDIIVKQAVFETGKRERHLTADDVDRLFDKIVCTVHDAAANDLDAFLFEEHLDGSGDGEVDSEDALATADAVDQGADDESAE